jgi:hypothetical protein
MAEVKAKVKGDEVVNDGKTPKKKVNGGGEKPKKKGGYLVSVDNTPEEVLKLDKEGYELAFDLDRFLSLDDDVVEELSRKNYANYCVAENQIAQRELSKTKRRDPNYVQDWELGILGGNAKNRMEKALVGVKKGWHGCLKAPDEVDEALSNGYKFVYKLSDDKQKLVDEGKAKPSDFADDPGTSTPVRLGQEDKPELIAMQIPEEKWQKHLVAIGYKSKGRWERQKEDYFDKVERAGLIPTDSGKMWED